MGDGEMPAIAPPVFCISLKWPSKKFFPSLDLA